jgi:hypothetical protein
MMETTSATTVEDTSMNLIEFFLGTDSHCRFNADASG